MQVLSDTLEQGTEAEGVAQDHTATKWLAGIQIQVHPTPRPVPLAAMLLEFRGHIWALSAPLVMSTVCTWGGIVRVTDCVQPLCPPPSGGSVPCPSLRPLSGEALSHGPWVTFGPFYLPSSHERGPLLRGTQVPGGGDQVNSGRGSPGFWVGLGGCGRIVGTWGHGDRVGFAEASGKFPHT